MAPQVGVPRLLVIVAVIALPACFKAPELSPSRSLELWRLGRLGARDGAAAVALAAGGAATLDVEAAVALALRESATARGARARLAVARAEGEAATQLENPQLRLRNVAIDRMIDGSMEMELALRVPIPQPWTRDAQARRAKLRFAEVQAASADLGRQLRGVVRKLFARLRALELDDAHLTTAIALAAQQRAIIATRVETGVATEVDASILRLRHAMALDQQAALKLRRTQLIGQLRLLVGARPGQQITFRPARGPFVLRALKLSTKALIERSLRRRKDLRRAAARVGVAQADAYIARSQRWPWLRFAELSYRVRDPLQKDSFDFMLAIDLPLLSWNSGSIAAGDAQLARRRIEEKALLLSAVGEVEDAARRLRVTAERLQAARRSLLPAMDAGSAAVKIAMRHGMVDPLRATILEWRRVRAQRRYLEAGLAHQDALIDLEAAVGGPVPLTLAIKEAR